MDAETARCDWGGCDLCAFARERPSRVRRDIYSETLCIYSLAYAVRVHANDVASRCDAVGTFAIHHRHRKHPKHEPNNPSNKHRHRHRHQSIRARRAIDGARNRIRIYHTHHHRIRPPSPSPSPIHPSIVVVVHTRASFRKSHPSIVRGFCFSDDDDQTTTRLWRRPIVVVCANSATPRRRRRPIGKIFRILAPNLCGVATDRPTERPSSVWLPCARDDDGGVLACDTQDVVVVCFIFILFYFARARYGVFSGDAM